jgi:oligoendopeptidase F
MITDNNEELVQVLNDLIRINNDRIRGYEKAIQKTNDSDKQLVEVFSRMIDDSRQYEA